MSSVTPGSVAPRAPASLAALRARVWDSERRVGAMNTVAAASAAATAAGGSCPSTSRGSITQVTGSPPSAVRRLLQRGAERLRRAVDDDHHVLARLHAEAGLHDGPHRPLEVAHGAGTILMPWLPRSRSATPCRPSRCPTRRCRARRPARGRARRDGARRDLQPLPVRDRLEPAPAGGRRRLRAARRALPRHQRQRRRALPGGLARADAPVRRRPAAGPTPTCTTSRRRSPARSGPSGRRTCTSSTATSSSPTWARRTPTTRTRRRARRGSGRRSTPCWRAVRPSPPRRPRAVAASSGAA